ncbi:hypothetical protein MPSEU_000499200 [Mayamaea pseudoterrestris]|nr:hypothetical protein MPSEU_000499200 [Mayamaea pseudoterrestris]
MTVHSMDPMDPYDEKAVLHYTGFEETEDLIPKPQDTFYAITGNESQVLTIRLQEGEQVRGEPGSMFYLSSGMSQSINCSDSFKRCCTGESCCVVDFTNSQTGPGYASLTPSFPTAKVVPVDLSSAAVGESLIAQQGSFMASYGDVQIQIDFDCNFMRCCCGGMGLIRQRLVGSGTAFLSSTGTMVQKILQPGESILVDTFCLLAYSGSCKFDLQRVGGIVGMMGGGEGIFNSCVTGPGLVIISSMNPDIFKQALAAQKLYRR